MGTTRTARVKPNTNWKGRNKPILYVAPLQDAYRIVRDQDNSIIYILSDTGKPMSLTNWKARTPI